MANAYTIDKLDTRTKKALVKDILSNLPTNQIAKNYEIPVACVHRYKADKLFKEVAEVWSARKENTAAEYEQQLSLIADKLNKTLEAIDKELDSNGTGEYDLSDPARAIYYVKMLNDTSRSLQTNLLTISKIAGDIKEAAEVRPYEILRQIGRAIIDADVGKEATERIIAALDGLRTQD